MAVPMPSPAKSISVAWPRVGAMIAALAVVAITSAIITERPGHASDTASSLTSPINASPTNTAPTNTAPTNTAPTNTASATDNDHEPRKHRHRVMVPIIDLVPVADAGGDNQGVKTDNQLVDGAAAQADVAQADVAQTDVAQTEVVAVLPPPAPKATPPKPRQDGSDVAAEVQPLGDTATLIPDTIIRTPAWQRHAVAVAESTDRPKIAIVIDDLGLSRTRTQQTVDLPAPLTLAFLPYAKGLDLQAQRAKRAGHELLVHIPMQPLDGKQDPGPRALTVDLPKEEVLRRLRNALGQFDGYVGINNHMGSKFTSDPKSMMIVLAELQRRGLMFLDSQTSSKSVAGDLADSLGLPAARRSVFLDHQIDPAAIRQSLNQLEAVARHVGFAVGIGHPHRETLEALADWLPTLTERGFQLVPISAVAKLRSARTDSQVAARR